MPNALVAAAAEGLPKFQPQNVLAPPAPSPKRTTSLMPWEGPAEYCLVGEGDCMSPDIESGAALIFDRREPCRPGDIVVLWLRPECVRPGSHQLLIKRLISVTSSGPQPRVRVEMNNPHRQWDIPRNRLLGMHRCMGPVPPHRQRVKVTDEQVRALGLQSN